MSDKPPSDGRACFYATMLPRLIATARECGYALAVHGSLVNDLDLIAVPWVDEAKPAVELVEALLKTAGGFVPGGVMPGFDLDLKPGIEKGLVLKPHGRLSWNIHWGGHVRIDLAVMPLVVPLSNAAPGTDRDRDARRVDDPLPGGVPMARVPEAPDVQGA